MKKYIIASILPALAALAAQAEGFAYQGYLSGIDGKPAAGETVDVTFSINTPEGTSLYSESHAAVCSDGNGRIAFTVGEGKPELGAFRLIDWSIDGLEAEIEIARPGGFTTVSVEPLASTPYAMGASQASGLVSTADTEGRRYTLAVDDSGKLSTVATDSKVISIPSGYSRLIFHDEFDYEGLPDPRYWGYEEGYVRGGEMQYYTKARLDNAFVADGCLNLRVLADNWTDDKGQTHAVTSASVTTQDKVKFTYGRVDVRAKVPSVLGSWPAIWLMPNDSRYGAWPNSGEIDIMESVGHANNIVYFTAHCAEQNGGSNAYHSSAYVKDCHTDFHTYSLIWNSKRLEWLVDGKRKFAVMNNAPTWRGWPYSFDFYVILNYAFGGSWGGQQGVDVNALPSTFQVDYVRIFQ
ncbi:MAG: glycoside hydrolase family 16 protein [Muribaculaceae bacterium]|nr:glycoside hydrolase family 16 protein [Muribaculaceae bacterium]